MKKISKGIYQRSICLLTGMGALVWFLIRVIPKPSRATYPCMRAAAPIASSFVMYMVGLATTAVLFLKSKQRFYQSKYIVSTVFLFIGLLVGLLTTTIMNKPALSNYEATPQAANDPMGTAKGINPGRVVWIHNADATNENCTNGYGDGWFLAANNDQDVIDQMVSLALQELTDEVTDIGAWNAIFQYYNENHGKGPVNYAADEKMLIKTNATSSWAGNFNTTDLSIVENNSYGISETSPHVVLSVLRQLVHVVGVDQADIYVGDPMKHIYKHCYDLWYAEFPNVHYLDYSYGAEKGREQVVASADPLIFYSDRGTTLRTGTWNDAAAGDAVTEDHLYTVFQDVDYMINIPALKAHARAGITLFAKNHFGSHTRTNALQLHMGLVDPDGNNSANTRFGMGLYRVQVDLMGHELLGEKNLIYLLDGLWAGSEAVDPPSKWSITPFNNDWTSSIFLSQDPVAIESVAFDFLKAEYTNDHPIASYPQMDGVDDYLHQAADASNWPDGISYDPENDGTPLQSLGVHEHWNNATDKQYSRNLGTGDGIELINIESGTIGVDLVSFAAYENNGLICLEWETADESGCAGFNIYRSISTDGRYERINAQLIKAKSPSTGGATYRYEDTPDRAALYFYKLETVDLDGTSIRSKNISVSFTTGLARLSTKPEKFDLKRNYPNPFNPSTRIDYQLAGSAFVDIAIYNLQGQLIRHLVHGEKSAGYHSEVWQTRNDRDIMVGAGVYIVRMVAGEFSKSYKMTLIR